MADPLAEKVVQPAVNPQHLAYCPTMDLIALATIDDHVHVFRLNGQKVFGVTDRRTPGKVNNIKWKPDGQVLAVAFSNSFLSLTNSHTGKMMHQIDCSGYSKSQICCLGWGITFTDSTALKLRFEKRNHRLNLDDMISQNPQIKALDSVPDLPQDLALLDVEGLLPKLSPLPSGDIEDDVFSSRASLDSLFQPLSTASTDSADILVVGFEDGTIHLSIYDFFEIGSFNLQQAFNDPQGCKPLLHCSHPLSTTHSLLVSAVSNGVEELQIVPLDLRLISSMGRYLSSLASKSTQLHNILRYVKQVQRQMHSDFKASQDLPSRFIANVEEDLLEVYGCNWVQAAYHLVVTGNCYPEIKEWLVNQLGERGYKRWDKAVVTGYESVRRLTHENLLPALERCLVLVSRLRGLSKFQVSNVRLGLLTQELDSIIDTVNCLQLVAHHVLINASSELIQFQAFSAWLHQEIDTQSSEPNLSEIAEKDSNVDYESTLEYIQGAMTHSRLTRLFDVPAEADQRPQWDLMAEERSLFELFKREIKHQDHEGTRRLLPNLETVIGHLGTQCNFIFSRIAETQRRNVRFGPPISLAQGLSHCMDTRMIVEQPGKTHEAVLYVALGPRHQETSVQIYRIVFKIENGMSTTTKVECAYLQMMGLDVKDLKIVDDDDLLLAVLDGSSSRLLRLPYRKELGDLGGLKYAAVNDDSSKAPQRQGEQIDHSINVDFSDVEQVCQYTWHEFSASATYATERMEVNGRKGRRVACVLAQDRFHYRIYDLDNDTAVEHAGEIETEESDTAMS